MPSAAAGILIIMHSLLWTLQVGFQAIAEALGLAGLKAIVAISAIIAGGRLVTFHFVKIILKVLCDLEDICH